MRITAASDSSLLISFSDEISAEAHAQVIALFHALCNAKYPHIRNVHPAYASLLIDFDPLSVSHEALSLHVEELSRSLPASEQQQASVPVIVPVCYDEEFAPDLTFVAQHCGLSRSEVIAAHSGRRYFVYFLGFAPGFAYLGGLAPSLHVPRHASPRRHVEAGSVGLAGTQTGVYPMASPGGWQIIGRTPLRMFDPSASRPSRLQPGDTVQFTPITRAEYARMLEEQPR